MPAGADPSNIAVDMMDNAKGVAHMPTATTITEDSCSKLVQNHPHDFTKKAKNVGPTQYRVYDVVDGQQRLTANASLPWAVAASQW